MTSTEVVHVPTTELMLFEQESRADRRRRKLHRQQLIVGGVAGCIGLSASTIVLAALWFGGHASTVSADEVIDTTIPVEQTTTTWPEPELAPTTTEPGWQRPIVRFVDGDFQGRLITDGKHAEQILPGDVGSAIVSVNHDLAGQQTIVVDGVAWRVVRSGTVKPENLNPLFRRTVVPTLFLLSEQPVPDRPYLEMVQK